MLLLSCSIEVIYQCTALKTPIDLLVTPELGIRLRSPSIDPPASVTLLVQAAKLLTVGFVCYLA